MISLPTIPRMGIFKRKQEMGRYGMVKLYLIMIVGPKNQKATMRKERNMDCSQLGMRMD